jgi:hypothetical protein
VSGALSALGRDSVEVIVRVLDPIPFRFCPESLQKELRVRPGTGDAVARLRAVYAEAFVENRGEETVRLDGVTFHSRALRRSLGDVERVFPFVATCGQEIEEAKPAPQDDVVAGFWWDALQERLLDVALAAVADDIEGRFRLNRTVMMSPGAAEATVWPIEEQGPLFALLGDVESRIGVQLNESFFMIPTKSVSGIRFASERDLESCQVCRRQDCPRRTAPFEPALWQDLQG